MPDELHDTLAKALRELVNDLNGYAGCPTIQAQVERANKQLVLYQEAKRKADRSQERIDFQLWLRTNYNDLWLQWLGASSRHCISWAEANCPEVRREYVNTYANLKF